MRELVLAVTMLASAWLLGACGGAEGSPPQLRLADLVAFAERYDGERVATTGIVRSHADPRHYWIQDEALHRVAVAPHSAVSAHVGERVRVVGRFRYSPQRGRRIEAESTTVLGD